MSTAPTDEFFNRPRNTMPAFNPILQRVVGGFPMVNAPIGTPPFFPGQPGAPQVPPGNPGSAHLTPKPGGGFFDKADAFLNRPSGNLLMNLLAQSGYSTMPQSPLGAVGRAALMTQNQQQQREMTDLEKRLVESRIGLNSAKADPQNLNATADNVQSTFKGENGNMYLITRAGEVRDTGVPFNETVKFIENADGSVTALDSSTGERLGEVISSEEALEERGTAQEQDIRVKDRAEAAVELPQQLAALDSTLTSIDSVMEEARRARGLVSTTSTGLPGEILKQIPGTDARKLQETVKTIQANLGFSTLQKMREASKTGGALGQVSERELDLLVSALTSLESAKGPVEMRRSLDKVLEHYGNYKREIQIMQGIIRERAGQPPRNNRFEGFSIATD